MDSEEPEDLGARLRRIEAELWKLRGDVAQARAAERLFDDVLEHVLMPAILLLAGQGHREQLQAMLQRAAEAQASDPHVDELLRQGGADLLEGWRQWVEDLPQYEPPHFQRRHPDMFPTADD